MSVRIDKDKRSVRRIVCDRFWPDGRRFRRFMPDEKTAEEVNARILVSIKTGTWREYRQELERGQKNDFTVVEFAEHYLEIYCKPRNKSWKRKAGSLKHIKRHLGRVKLRDLTRKDLNEFVAKRLQEGAKPATVNRDTTTLRHMLEFAAEEGNLKENPLIRMRKLKESREERPRVNQQQFRKISQYLPFPVKQMVEFIWETGCRPSEAMGLKREHVELEKKVAVLNLRKAGDNALIALTSRAVKAIRAVPELAGCPYVFWNPKTGTRYQRINETFGRAREKAALPWVQLKDFRRAVAITIAESGVPLHIAQTQLGHSSIRTTETCDRPIKIPTFWPIKFPTLAN